MNSNTEQFGCISGRDETGNLWADTEVALATKQVALPVMGEIVSDLVDHERALLSDDGRFTSSWRTTGRLTRPSTFASFGEPGLTYAAGLKAATIVWVAQDFAEEHRAALDWLNEITSDAYQFFGLQIELWQIGASDTLQQANAFLSVKFSGPELHRDGLSMKTFKGLVDNFYESVTKLFTPSSLTGARTNSLFDYEMYQPQFSSLVLSIKQPVIDIDAIRRRRKIYSNTLHDDIQNELAADRDEFIRTAKELLDRADRNSGLEDFISQHYEFSSAIANLAPYDGGGFDRVEFNALTATGLEGVVITEQAGTKIREARDSAATAPKQITGVIIEVNGERRTFVMKDRAERQVTCAFDWEMFERHHNAGSIFIGAKVTLFGDFWTRVRRDYIHVTREPAFH